MYIKPKRRMKLSLKTDTPIERVVYVNRVCKVVAGGKRFHFHALVVVGDGQGTVGFALGKAKEVPEAIRKGIEKAKKNLIRVPILNDTIPHEIVGKFKASKVVLKPARRGTGIVAGGVVRAVMEAAGIKNILSKCIGSRNPHNVLKATFDGLEKLFSKEEVENRRGIKITTYRQF